MNKIFFAYTPRKSYIHTLDPRTKLISVMLLSFTVLKASTFQDIILLSSVFFIFAFLAQLGIKHHFNSLRPMLMFFIFIFIVQIIFTESESTHSAGALGISYEGICKGVIVTLRFVLLILFTSLIISTTSPAILTQGIERLLRPFPLSFLGVSSYDIAVMISISMRFLPLLYESVQHTIEAQISRGINPQRFSFKSISFLVVPMINNALRMTENLSIAMESRCYQGIHRTSMFELKMHKKDWISLFIMLIFVLLFLY
ncbi:MAG: energy-coupling factor transporter transmembrane protein EcfT [Methanomethylovorans sp.]|jgi:energy-coupling factor transport system permease protein|nr:energy-coupling factor transporter transmembrane protein EcfT [Methanomethylovorans sp.]